MYSLFLTVAIMYNGRIGVTSQTINGFTSMEACGSAAKQINESHNSDFYTLRIFCFDMNKKAK